MKKFYSRLATLLLLVQMIVPANFTFVYAEEPEVLIIRGRAADLTEPYTMEVGETATLTLERDFDGSCTVGESSYFVFKLENIDQDFQGGGFLVPNVSVLYADEQDTSGSSSVLKFGICYTGSVLFKPETAGTYTLLGQIIRGGEATGTNMDDWYRFAGFSFTGMTAMSDTGSMTIEVIEAGTGGGNNEEIDLNRTRWTWNVEAGETKTYDLMYTGYDMECGSDGTLSTGQSNTYRAGGGYGVNYICTYSTAGEKEVVLKNINLKTQFGYGLQGAGFTSFWLGLAPNITYLTLRGHGLTELADNIFDNATGIQNLELANNKLTELPSSIIGLTNLQSLRLEDNLLRTLPEELLVTMSGYYHSNLATQSIGEIQIMGGGISEFILQNNCLDETLLSQTSIAILDDLYVNLNRQVAQGTDWRDEQKLCLDIVETGTNNYQLQLRGNEDLKNSFKTKYATLFSQIITGSIPELNAFVLQQIETEDRTKILNFPEGIGEFIETPLPDIAFTGITDGGIYYFPATGENYLYFTGFFTPDSDGTGIQIVSGVSMNTTGRYWNNYLVSNIFRNNTNVGGARIEDNYYQYRNC